VSEPAGSQEVSFRIALPPDSGDTPIVYSNHFHATVTPEDLTLHLGWYAIPPFAEPPKGIVDVPVRPLVKVTVPLNLVRGIISVLQNQLAAWEHNFGQAIPPHPNPPPASPVEAPEAEDAAR
jgi:hypothetical protein